MRTRIFTLLVAFLAIAGNAVWGQETTTPDTEIIGSKTFYLLDSKEDLEWFRDYVNEGNPGACAKLTDNINLNPNFTFSEDGYSGSGTPEEWEPIMSKTGSGLNMSACYTGVFDGGGFTIKGLYINKENSSSSNPLDILSSLYTGLFGIVGDQSATTFPSSGEVKNLIVEGYIECNVPNMGAGGICGVNYGTIQDCINKVDIVGKGNKTEIGLRSEGLGGICYINEGTIRSCVNEGNIITSLYTSGGICGLNSGIIEKCYNSGTIMESENGNAWIGGICGNTAVSTSSSEFVINNCYNIGKLKAEQGKAAGISNLHIANTSMKIEITNCHSYEIVEGNGENAGICTVYTGSYSIENQTTIQNCYYLNNTATTGCLYITETSTTPNDQPGQTEAKSETAFDNGEVLWFLQQKEGDERVWTQGENDDYPVFISDNNKYKAYRVTFDYNCDELPDTYQYTIEYKEETVNFPADPTREGYNFLGWSEDEEGEVISSTENIPITQDITYYAQWQKIETEEPEQPGDDEDEDQGGDIYKPQRPIKYYNIYVDTICPGLDVEVSKDVVQEGHQVSAYLTIQAECDTTGMRFEYKRGLFGYWKDLKELEGVQPGEYIIKNIYTDIYIRALDATLPEEEPTGIDDLEGVKAYAKEGSIYVYTPNREEVTIISMSGAIIKHAEQVGLQSYSVSRGIYIVRIGEKVFKLKN